MPRTTRSQANITGGTVSKVPPDVIEEPIDRHRAWMAKATILIFAITVLMGFAVSGFASNDAWTRTNDLLKVVIPVETLLIGAVAGHYFGAKL